MAILIKISWLCKLSREGFSACDQVGEDSPPTRMPEPRERPYSSPPRVHEKNSREYHPGVSKILPLSSLDQAGTQARSTYVHLFGSAVHFYSNRLHVSFPHLVGSSMWMAHRVAKVSSFFANWTFSHDLHLLKSNLAPDIRKPQQYIS